MRGRKRSPDRRLHPLFNTPAGRAFYAKQGGKDRGRLVSNYPEWRESWIKPTTTVLGFAAPVEWEEAHLGGRLRT
jgi:hypothetical protein